MTLAQPAYAMLADAVVAFHTLFVAFVVGGQVLILLGWARGWQWTRGRLLRIAHLAAIGYVAFEAWSGMVCPLTLLENHFRVLSGEAAYSMSFIGYWLNRLLFYNLPLWVFTLIYSFFFLLVAITFFACPPRFRRNAKAVG